MGNDNNKNDELAQRDKEMRAPIFDSLFTRLTWLDAATIAAIAAYLSSGKLAACPALFAKLAVASFAASLAIELYVPVRRAWAVLFRICSTYRATLPERLNALR